MLAVQFFLNYRLHVIRARPFNHTGPGQSSEFVCSDWARQFAEIELRLRRPIVRVGNLEPRRDLSDVRDVARAYWLLLQKGKPGEAYNVGSGHAVPLRTVLTGFLSLCSHEVRVEADPQRVRPGEVAIVYGDLRKLRSATGWKPKYNLTTTLRDLYRYWVSKLDCNRVGRSLCEPC
jgi:GDP-4-dehydro-6-deoxy-D-mannose reductase